MQIWSGLGEIVVLRCFTRWDQRLRADALGEFRRAV
jgi:hypothetical protein